MRVMGSDATPQAIKWVAFPPPGPVPFGSEIHFGELDNAGWSVQSDEIDLTGAQVTVTSQGANLPVTVSTLPPGYGSNSAISFRPQGWASRPGIDYEVKVTCSSGQVISYTVSPVKC